MQRFFSALVAVIALGSAASGISSSNNPGAGRYYDFIKQPRPLDWTSRRPCSPVRTIKKGREKPNG